METYDLELEKTAFAFKSIPKKPTESNIIYLGTLNHFETFEDDLCGDEKSEGNTDVEMIDKTSGKRISLSGSIIVLDIDFDSHKNITDVHISLSEEAGVQSECSPLNTANNPEARLLLSLNQPRLDTFNKNLRFLSSCDRFSTREVNCFGALDVLAEAITRHINATKTQSFGEVLINPNDRVGFGLKFASNCAYLDVMLGQRPQYALRNFKTSSDWFENEDPSKWRENLPLVNYESRAELVLILDPPITVSDKLANQLEAIVCSSTSQLDAQCTKSSFKLDRPPEFAAKHKKDEYSVHIGNMMPHFLVEISEVPISSPSVIPQTLQELHKFAKLTELLNSLLRGDETRDATELQDITISDALDLPVALTGSQGRRSHIAVSFYQETLETESPLIILCLWPVFGTKFLVEIGSSVIAKFALKNEELTAIEEYQQFESSTIELLNNFLANGELYKCLGYLTARTRHSVGR